MTEPSGGSSTKPSRPVVVPAVALVAATGLGITALLGGLEERPDPAPPKLGAGQTLDQGQFETQFVESRYSEKKAENEFAKDKRFLDLVFKVTNKTDDPSFVGSPPNANGGGGGFGGSVLKMTPEIKTQFGPETFIQSKGATSRILQPGVPSTVVFRYELGPGVKPPQQVSLEVGKFEELESAVDGSTNWMLASESGFQDEKATDTVAATVTLPVKQGPAS
ncbi:hypothetical protein [Nonomuraea sediminis]|uniref:hypothetical protein n=1 Tax=Nonomuraea sediminis TaxID=2835864 RepID=UPI001BDBF669|nr:hypothetical protein [Nonomuraea sediminis]